MKIISSQHYIDDEIVERKVAELKESGVDKIVVPCYYVGEIDGEEYALMSDRHHTMAAARILGLGIEYDINDDPEGLTGEAVLVARYNDGDYYNVETSNPAEFIFDLIW